MDMVPDDETGGFIFYWTIQNFSYCLLKRFEFLRSSSFKLNFPDLEEWSLMMYPRGSEKNDCMEVYLSVKYTFLYPVKVKHCISICTTNGTYKSRNEDFSPIFIEEFGLVNKFCINHSDLFKNGDYAFLENDTLIVRCRFWTEHSSILPVSGQCYAITVIKVERIAFSWTLENFKELLHTGRKTIDFETETQSFTVDIYLTGEIDSEKNIQVEIKLNTPYQKEITLNTPHQICSLICKLSLLDVDGKTTQPVREFEHWFTHSVESQNWLFTFMPVEKILQQEKLYLVNGDLSLRCLFTVSSGASSCEIVVTEYGIPEEDVACDCDRSFPGSWKGNLQKIFEEGTFSDLTIRTASRKKFPVHKAILNARSEVFRDMFEKDTKNRTGILEIEGVNDDTVSKILLFIYTDILEDLDWKMASELYLAAEKYGIVALKRKCSNYLKSNLNSDNVCDVRALAEMNRDEGMKLAAQDFEIDHATEVDSKYWKKF